MQSPNAWEWETPYRKVEREIDCAVDVVYCSEVFPGVVTDAGGDEHSVDGDGGGGIEEGKDHEGISDVLEALGEGETEVKC